MEAEDPLAHHWLILSRHLCPITTFPPARKHVQLWGANSTGHSARLGGELTPMRRQVEKPEAAQRASRGLPEAGPALQKSSASRRNSSRSNSTQGQGRPTPSNYHYPEDDPDTCSVWHGHGDVGKKWSWVKHWRLRLPSTSPFPLLPPRTHVCVCVCVVREMGRQFVMIASEFHFNMGVTVTASVRPSVVYDV